ncbi:gonadotropin subunit beta-1-like [Cololabis saira]|uniref:gonadotropin subunit beta-1-like n=1 Tax=Cololabis saira TaxID=129043 RepID=UPI002AD44297|nr:gonadotropin subunit beta-1-like [Cololabis saira]
MKLVVMAAVLAMVEVGQGSCSRCHLKDVSICVERCGITELIHTTICEGWCYQEDSIFMNHGNQPQQNICNGDWTYEEKFIEGCPESFIYPVATNCGCTTCNTGNTFCGRPPTILPSC